MEIVIEATLLVKRVVLKAQFFQFHHGMIILIIDHSIYQKSEGVLISGLGTDQNISKKLWKLAKINNF